MVAKLLQSWQEWKLLKEASSPSGINNNQVNSYIQIINVRFIRASLLLSYYSFAPQVAASLSALVVHPVTIY
jgi:hypothetical protein